jgi:hypothetical protein
MLAASVSNDANLPKVEAAASLPAAVAAQLADLPVWQFAFGLRCNVFLGPPSRFGIAESHLAASVGDVGDRWLPYPPLAATRGTGLDGHQARPFYTLGLCEGCRRFRV